MRVDELLSLAKDCLAGRKVLAVDLCGEPSANAPEAECSAASLVNQKLYGALAAKSKIDKAWAKSIINSYPDGVYRVTEHKEETSWVNVVHTAVNATGKSAGRKRIQRSDPPSFEN